MKIEKIALSLALAASYISAVMDRFGIWGPPGEPGVVWGNYENFLNYTKYLNSWAPDSLIPFLASSATFLEILLAIVLILGVKRMQIAYASAILLSLFAIAMITTDGLKGVLDYSVFTAMTASLLLAKLEKNLSNKTSENI